MCFAEEMVRHEKAERFMKLFHAEQPLQYVTIYILGPLKRTVRQNFHLVVVTDRFRKRTQVAQIRTINALNVVTEFFDNWVFPYGTP